MSFGEIKDDDDDDDYDDDALFVQEDAQAFCRENVGHISTTDSIPSRNMELEKTVIRLR